MKEKNRRIISKVIIIAILLSAIYDPSISFAALAGDKAGIYKGNGYEVEFVITDSWNNMYNVSIKLTNTSEKTIHDWYLKLPFTQTVTNIWNGAIKKTDAEYIYIKGADYDQDIAPGESVVFGMTIEGTFTGYPNACELLGTKTVVNEQDYAATYTVEEEWGSGFIGTITIENTSDHRIEDWGLDFRFENQIDNVWNALIDHQSGNEYKIGNAGYNQNIEIGESVVFGFCVPQGDSEKLVENMRVTHISLDSDGEMDGDHSGNQENDKKDTDDADSKEDAANPKDSDTESGGDNGGEEDENTGTDKGQGNDEEYGAADILTISEKGLTLWEEGYVFNDEFESFTGTLEMIEQIEDFTVQIFDRKNMLIYQENITPEKEWSMKKVGLVCGINRLVFSVSGREIRDTKEITVYCDNSAYMDALQVDTDDTDGDGLFNYLEDLLGTDKYNIDTDGDGLTDYEEVYYFGYNPLNPDTDGNGVSDYDEDADEDGISNGAELKAGYLPLNSDSDGDGLLDGEEIEFGTSPLNPSTRGKGITDYQEYQLEQLGCSYDEETKLYTKQFIYEQNEDSEYQEPVVPTIDFTGNADGVLTFQMERVEGDAYLNPSMKGYLGAAFNFTTHGSMKSAVLTFTYDEKLIGNDIISSVDFCPTIYYYNEGTGLLEEVEGQVWSGNNVSVTLSHFSTYILVNKVELETLWERTLQVENKLTKDPDAWIQTSFMVDMSDSMVYIDKNNDRFNIVRDYILNVMKEGERLSIYLFGLPNGDICLRTAKCDSDNRYEILEEFYELVEMAWREKDGRQDNMGSRDSSLMGFARSFLTTFEGHFVGDNDENQQKIKTSYLLTNGSFQGGSFIGCDYIQAMELYCTDSQKYGFISHIVGFGESTASFLAPYAERCGGQYFQWMSGYDPNDYYKETAPKIPENKEPDENQDGLNDELTKKICDGEITTITGTTIFSPDCYEEIMKSDDYDGDGLKNGEEIEIFQYRDATYFRLISSPEIYDSDCDGYSDYEEVKKMNTSPLEGNFVMNYQDAAYLTNVGNFESGVAFNKYVDSNILGVVGEKALDVIFCGGDFNLQKATAKELANCLASNVEENETTAMIASVGEMINTYATGMIELLPAVNDYEATFKRMEYTDAVNDLQKTINILKKEGGTEKAISTFQNKLKNINNKYVKYLYANGDEMGSIDKYGRTAGALLYITQAVLDKANELCTYLDSLFAIKNCMDVLEELESCHVDIVQQAARTVKRDLTGQIGGVITEIIKGGVENIITNIIGSFVLSKLKDLNLVIVLTSIALGIVLGDSMSLRMKNCISVNIAIGISIINNISIGNKLSKNITGDVQVVYDDSSDRELAKQLWLLNIHTLKRCEDNYYSYLKDGGGMLSITTLYHTKDSWLKAIDNSIELERIFNQYVI